jgi:Flp pilus assembly protein TadD
MRAFLQGDIVMADLYEMSRQELFDIAAQGQLFFDTGKFDEAATVFEGLVALDPYEGSFHTGLGAVYQQRNKLEEACIEYDRAIALNENDLAARCNRAEIRVQERNFDAAANDIKEIALRDPEGSSGHSQRAKVLAMALASMAQQALDAEDAD